MENLEQRIVVQLNSKKYNLKNKQNYQHNISMTSYNIKKKINLVFIEIVIQKNNINLVLKEVDKLHTKKILEIGKHILLLA